MIRRRRSRQTGGVSGSFRSRKRQGTASSLVPYWYDGLSVGNLDSSTNWQEMSGMATPRLAANAPYLWVNSDSPANMIACVNKSTAANTGVLTLTGQTAMIDLEDIESATVGGINYLYGMDFGNNGNGADSRGTGIDLRIFRIIEPTITGSNQSTSSFIEINCAFPAVNGPTLRDCEASIVDENGKIWIITKRDATQKLYSLAHAASYTGTQTLVYEGAMTSLPASTTVALTTTPCYAVDAAISPNGKEIFVKNYSNVYYFPRLTGETVIQALQKSLVIVDGYVGGGSTNPKTSHPNAEPQGEGLAFDYDGLGYYSTSEFVSTEGSSASAYPLFYYQRCPSIPTTIIFQQGVAPTGSYAGCENTYVWGTNPGTDQSASTSYVVDTTSGNATDDRRGLLSFNLSADIPTSKTVVGARLDQWLSAEGQGWKTHVMLVTWNSSYTQNTFGGAVNNDGVKAAVPILYQNGINLDTITGVSVRDNIPISAVQSWVATPATNFGLLFKGLDESVGGDGVQFESRVAVTASHRPKLTLRYI